MRAQQVKQYLAALELPSLDELKINSKGQRHQHYEGSRRKSAFP
jgi:hypothetical protein